MQNFRSEFEHDQLLISLVRDLSSAGFLDIVQRHFRPDNIGNLGNLECSKRTRLFDVELTFSHVSLIIESKVDSEEGRDKDMWQTTRIFEQSQNLPSLKEEKRYYFITYGTSEFYTKKCTDGNFRRGPGDHRFHHVGLESIFKFVRESLDCLVSCDKVSPYRDWLLELERELTIRSEASSLLTTYATFRRQYLNLTRDIDLPVNRLCVNLPELAFPLLGKLADHWNETQWSKTFGKVTVYPVSRRARVHDSILNFTELWGRSAPLPFLSCGGIIPEQEWNTLYFEINEDFNLNLKVDTEDKNLAMRIKEYLMSKKELPNIIDAAKGVSRFYKQETFVIYEWDINLLDNTNRMDLVCERLARTHDSVCKVLP